MCLLSLLDMNDWLLGNHLSKWLRNWLNDLGGLLKVERILRLLLLLMLVLLEFVPKTEDGT